jgi:hypothetical protein
MVGVVCILLIIDVYMSGLQVADASRLVGNVGAARFLLFRATVSGNSNGSFLYREVGVCR